MQHYKTTIRKPLPKLYSQDLLNNLFKYPYTKIECIIQDIGVGSNTAIRYLEALVKEGLVVKQEIGRDNFYINQPLFDLPAGINLSVFFCLPAIILLSMWQNPLHWNGYCVTCAALKTQNLKLKIYYGTGERNHFHKHREHFSHHQKISLFR